jgi:predicted RNA-binding protein with PUA-like domain
MGNDSAEGRLTMPAKKAAAKKATVKKATVKKATVKKATATKATVKKAAPKGVAVKSASGEKKAATKAAKKPPQSLPYELGKWAHVFTPRAPGERRYWLLKSEPDVFSFEDLQRTPKQTTCWDSVRNTAARNFMRDGMRVGDLAFYYHSNAEPSAIVGVCEVVSESYPDHTAFDPAHPYYDENSVRATPTWFMVDVRAVEALPRPVTLPDLKASTALRDMALIKVGRLSVVPVTSAEWHIILGMSSK